VRLKGHHIQIKYEAKTGDIQIEMHDFPSVETEMVGHILINSPAVMLLDVSQMRTTTVTKNVSVSLKSVRPDGSHRMMNASCLRGTTVVESLNGVATFSDLAITSATKNVVLIFAFDLFEVISEARQFDNSHVRPHKTTLPSHPMTQSRLDLVTREIMSSKPAVGYAPVPNAPDTSYDDRSQPC